MADFQNRVFAKYARSQSLPYVDIADRFPRDADLFDDAIHLKYSGLRLQAWLFVQSLVPLIEVRLASGRWPRPVQRSGTIHPAFDQPDRRRIGLSDLRARCS